MQPQEPDWATENALRNRSINDREQKERLLMTAGDQERQGIAAADVGMNYRADAQMRPSLMGAEDSRAKFQEGKPLRDFKQDYAMKALQGLDPGDMIGDSVGGQPGGIPGRQGMNPRLQEQIVRGLFNVGEDPDEMYNREAKQQLSQSLRAKAFEMVSSPDPRVRNQGAAILKAEGVQLPAGGLVGPGGDPQRTAQYMGSPQAKIKLQQLLSRAKSGMDSMRPEIAAQDIQSGIQEIAAEAAQFGADPEEVKALLLSQVEQAIPETSMWTDPIRTTLGLGGALFDTSENALRKGLGF